MQLRSRRSSTAGWRDPNSRQREWIRRASVVGWPTGGCIRVHQGVYAIGHLAATLRADYMAAVLACGPGARLSHRAEAHMLKVVQTKRPPPPEVTVVGTAGRKRPGITVHRVQRLHRLDTWTFDGIRVMSVPRLLLDLAASASLEELIARLPRGQGSLPDQAGAGRGVHNAPPGPPRRGPAAARADRRRDAEPARVRRSSSCCGATACRSRERTSITPATRSTAIGPSSASRSSC